MKKANNNPFIVGSKVLVDLPVYNIFHVPAKIDTGADSSSIWASQVKEQKGSLSFVLFDRDSGFYTGQQISTKQYKIRSVKNSFGHAEFRYKVRLSAVLEGKKIKVWFTLANREDNRYPILIGRRTLSNKFVVDVSKAGVTSANNKLPQVLVLVNSGGPTIRKFYSQMNSDNADKFQTIVEKYRNVVCCIEKNRIKLSIRGDKKEQNFNDFDMVYFKTSSKNAQIAALIAGYAKSINRPFFDSAASLQPAQSKILQMARLAQAGVNVPDTVYITGKKLNSSYFDLTNKLGKKLILKDNFGKKSRNRFVVATHKEFDNACMAAHENKVELIAQKFIPHDHFYRILVLGKRVEMVIKKQARVSGATGSKNTAIAVPVRKFPTEAAIMSVRAAEALGLQIAGVDIAQDKKTGLWYCFEVNSSPQLVAGAFVEKKRTVLAKFLYTQARS